MTTSHTNPRDWTPTQGRMAAIHGSYLVIEGTGERIGRCGDHGPHVANARRLAACWNACEGLDTDKLETLPRPFAELLSPSFMSLWSAYTEKKCEVEDLREERDTLLSLLTELMDTELAEIACTGSHAPVEDLLGRIRDTSTRIRTDIARGARQSDGKLPG